MAEKPVRKKGGKKKKNREIRHLTAGFVILFLVMMGYLGVYGMTHEEELLNNSYNNRQQLLKAQNTRGTIYGSRGEILAHSVENREKKEVREYPYREMFAHVVGYAEKGRMGIEDQANYYLIRSSVSSVSKVKDEIAGEKRPGDDVYTTLDVAVQEAAYKALGVYKGAVVAIEPATGKILAMVSKPDFDPNQIDGLWEELLADEESGVLLNRVSQGLYPAGSTMKIVTALEYIRENPDSYKTYRFDCTGQIRKEDSVINCYHKSRHGSVDLQTSFAKSCNSSFANIGLTLDKEAWGETLNGLLFNKELPLEGAYKNSRLEIGEESSVDDVMQSAIGQGKTQITPIHLCMITAAIANDGRLMKPYVVEKVESAEKTVIKSCGPEEYGALMSPEEAEILRGYMEEVVKNGTGTKLSGLSYTAAGKTGSAEYNREKGESHAWFTGFAPAEDPRIAVTVIIEGAGSGGDYAVPMARRVFDAFLNEER